MALHYSKYYHIKHREFVSKGVYNGFLDKDSLLHVDPLLLKNCTIPEFVTAYDEFFNYFRGFITLTKFAQASKTSDRFFKRMIERFTLSEIPNTGLGYSTSNTHGRGISGALSVQLATSAFEIIKAGLVDPEIFGLMQLIEDKMGADRISDMTLAILQKNFLAFTQRVAHELNIPTHSYQFNDEMFNVPFYNGKPVHFVPMCLLADLPIAHDFDEIDDVCNYNTELKRRVAKIIGVTWSEYKDYKKSDWKQIILSNKACYESAINFYKGLKAMPYDFEKDNKEQYIDILLEEFLAQYPLNFTPLNNTDPNQEVYDLTKLICTQFKHLVEDCRLSEEFYRKNRTPDETDWQMLLYAVADTYRVAGNIDVELSREDNPGVGEIDFHLTRGSKANTIIEIKRSGNADLLHGYRSQLAAYVRADRAKSAIFMVIVEDDSYEKIKEKISFVQSDMVSKGEYVPEVIYINGKRQPAASNPRYEDPRI